jgi:hypothetical protein
VIGVSAQLLSNYLSAQWNISSEHPLIATWVDTPDSELTYYTGIDYIYNFTLENTDTRQIVGIAIMTMTTGTADNFASTLNGVPFNPTTPFDFVIDGSTILEYWFVINFNTADMSIALTIHFDGDVT